MSSTNNPATTASTDVEKGVRITTPTAQATRVTASPANSGPKNACMANASLVCGIVGLFVFGVILGTLAIIFGCVAKGQIEKEPEKYEGQCQANAGLTLGIIGVVAWVIILIMVTSG